MEIDEESVCNGIKRKKPLAFGLEELLPTASGNGDLPPELVATSTDAGGCRPDVQKYRKEDFDLKVQSDSEIQDTIARIRNNVQKVGDKLPDKGGRLKANIRRLEIELERRRKLRSEKNYSTIFPPECLAGINGLRSQFTGAPNALTNDSLVDEKMQKIVNELVNIGISESSDVGKAAEVFYNHPIKAKVLFALPSHMRKSYVQGFLGPQN